MKNEGVTLLFKILVVLGGILGALLFIYPIVYAVINKDDIDGLMRGSKIILLLFILVGLIIAILIFVGSRSLTTSKIDKHLIESRSVDDLLNSLHDKLYADGYLFMKESNSKLGSIWVYKKSRLIRDDYFIIINFSNISACKETADWSEIFDINNIHYGIFLFCCDGLKSKNATDLLNLSKEGINQGYLIAVAEFQKSMLSFKKITDGFAKKRQHRYIASLLSLFNQIP